MNISPFNEWPLWHFFSLHMQNSGIVNDAFRTTSLTIPISLLSLDVKAGLSSAVDPYSNVTITQEAARNIINIVNNSFFYDFMNDRIIRVDALDRSKVFISNANIVVNEQALSSIPQGSLLITKSIAKTSPTGGISGGELVPLLGTPTYMREAVMSLSNAQAITRGETTSRYDFLSTLPQQERDRLQSLFRRPIYENTAIQLVLTSYRKQASIPLDLEKKVARLSNSLKKVIPDDKAINVATGTSVKLKACYNIEEYQVIPPGSNEYRTVKFAFPNKMRDEDRQMYIQLLTDRFKATKAKAQESSSEQRRAIMARPVKSTPRSYTSLMRSNEFQTYINRANMNTQFNVIDTTSVLHNEPAITTTTTTTPDEEEGEDEYMAEDTNELDEY